MIEYDTITEWDLWDVILRCNSTNQVWVKQKQKNVSPSDLYLQFKDWHMPEDAPKGEYTVYAIWDIIPDYVEYEFSDDVLHSLVHVDGVTLLLEDLRPITNLMQYGATASLSKDMHLKDNNDNKYLYL